MKTSPSNGIAVNGFIPSKCPNDPSHGIMDFIYANGERWECFICGTYVDRKGGVIESIKFCDTRKGGIINQ